MRFKVTRKPDAQAPHPIEYLPLDKALMEVEKAKVGKEAKMLLKAILCRIG